MPAGRVPRLRLALRPLTGAAAIATALALRSLCLLAWPVAWAATLALARPPRWWSALAARSLSRGSRARAYAWALADTPPRRAREEDRYPPAGGGHAPGAAATHDRALAVDRDAPHGLTPMPRGWFLLRPLTALPYALLRYLAGAVGYATGLLLAAVGTVSGRRAARLARPAGALSAFAYDCDRYVLGLAPARPRLPEPDPRLGGAPAAQPADQGPLPGWPRRLAYPAVALDFGISIGALIAAYGAAAALYGSDAELPAGLELAATLAIQLLPPVAVGWLAARRGPVDATLIGLGALRPLRSLLEALGVLGAIAVGAIALAFLAAIPFAGTEGQTSPLFSEDATFTVALGFVVATIVLAPVLEEILYRGFLFQFLRERRGSWSAAVLSSLVFAAAHLEFDPAGLANRTMIGIVLCWLFARTRRLLPAILLHAINNATITAVELGWSWPAAIALVLGALAASTALAWAIARLPWLRARPAPAA